MSNGSESGFDEYFAETCYGAEIFVQSELKSLNIEPVESYAGIVVFKASPEQAIKAAYLMQSISRVCYIIQDFSDPNSIIKDLDDKESKIHSLQNILAETSLTFRVTSSMMTSEATKSQELVRKIGSKIISSSKNSSMKLDVDLDAPDVTFIISITDDKAFLGIDMVCQDLSKRDYKVFPSRTSLRSIVGFCCVSAAGFDGSQLLFDPFCNDGVITIEATLRATAQSHNRFRKKDLQWCPLTVFQDIIISDELEKIDSTAKTSFPGTIFAFDSNMPNVVASKKNAKIAGVDKLIKFSRTSLDWADTKFDEHEIQIICTYIPASKDKKSLIKQVNELFYQSDYVLQKKGKIWILHESEIPAKDHDIKSFQKTFSTIIFQGAKNIALSCFERTC